MDQPREILISEQAYDAVLDATDDGYSGDLETGGSLVCHDGDVPLIAYALPPGPSASRGPAHVRTDADYQSAALGRVLRGCPGLSYAGDWHVHPMYLPSLSALDRATARAILLSERRGALVLLLGTFRPGHGPVLLGYVARLSKEQALLTEEVPLRLIDSDGPEVHARLGQPLPELDGLLGDPETGPEPEPVTHPAAERIRRELGEVRAALGARAELYVGDEGLYARVRRGARQALVLFPPEYPLGAPRVYRGSPHVGPLLPVGLPYAWSSGHQLLDPVAAALTSPLRQALRQAAAAVRLGLHALRRSLIITPEDLR